MPHWRLTRPEESPTAKLILDDAGGTVIDLGDYADAATTIADWLGQIDFGDQVEDRRVV